MCQHSAPAILHTCELTAVALSGRRRNGARLISGERRQFGLNASLTTVHVPYPTPAPDWTLRTYTCGVALQCAPSKDRIGQYPLHQLSQRELAALAIVEGGVALGWLAAHWPGLFAEAQRALPGLVSTDHDLEAIEILSRTDVLARSRQLLTHYPLLGAAPASEPARRGLAAAAKRYGRMPWSSRRSDAQRLMSIPIGGEGGVRNTNLPPASRPEDDDPDIRTDLRAGIPYPEWNAWREQFLPDHVAVLERPHPPHLHSAAAASADIRRWFEAPTHRLMINGLDDGSDLDVDAYVRSYTDRRTGMPDDANIFRALLPSARDVTTALLLDGSSSLGVHHGRVFELELSCADALSRAMTLARERHGIFVFSGNTRHRVEVRCLKDFGDGHVTLPSRAGLVTGGYTRLGAPIRHLTSRLLAEPAGRRVLIVIGDGLMSDEGYEGRYAWADVAHAVQEADDAGVGVYYLGLGPVRVDPLPEVFGHRRSQRIRRVQELPRALAHVHRELVSA